MEQSGSIHWTISKIRISITRVIKHTIVKQIKRAKRVHRHPIRYWSEEEKKQILDLHNAGISDKEIAREFNARSHQVHMVRINYVKKLSGVKW